MTINDLTGQKFGALLVLELKGVSNSVTYWKCQCDCGNMRIIRRNGLTQAKRPSCGCQTNINQKKAVSLPNGEGSFNELYRRYKFTAKTKSLEFSLSKEEFKKLTSKNCAYCNEPPKSQTSSHKNRHNGIYIYNGVDRQDNTKGYTLKNSVTCCEICNRMKLRLSVGLFFQHITKIYKFGVKRAKKI